jgi:hypothetical protein
MTDYAAFAARSARLCMLKLLHGMVDGRANETLLSRVLDDFGHRATRDYVRTQMRKLDEVGAVRLSEMGPYLVASITRAGMDHMERRAVIEGIARPSPED